VAKAETEATLKRPQTGKSEDIDPMNPPAAASTVNSTLTCLSSFNLFSVGKSVKIVLSMKRIRLRKVGAL